LARSGLGWIFKKWPDSRFAGAGAKIRYNPDKECAHYRYITAELYIFSGKRDGCEPVDKDSHGSGEPSVSESTQLSLAGIDSTDVVPVSEPNMTVAGFKQRNIFSRLGPKIQEAADQHAAAKNTDYRDATWKLQSGHPIPDTLVAVVYGEDKARQRQQREV